MDLTLIGILKSALQHLRDNQLVRRVWKRSRGLLITVLLISLFQAGIGYLAGLLISQAGFMGGNVAGAVLFGVSTFVFSLAFLIAYVGLPFFYTRWYYKRFWLNDESMRLAPFDPVDRFYGLVVPLCGIYFAYTIPSILINNIWLIADYLLDFDLGYFAASSSVESTLGLVIQLVNLVLLTITSTAFSFLFYYVLALRSFSVLPETRPSTGYSRWGYLRPLLTTFIVFLLMGVLSVLLHLIFGVDGTAMKTDVMVIFVIAGLLVQIVGIYLLWFLVRRVVRKDFETLENSVFVMPSEQESS